jgi:hypothetical protein
MCTSWLLSAAAGCKPARLVSSLCFCLSILSLFCLSFFYLSEVIHTLKCGNCVLEDVILQMSVGYSTYTLSVFVFDVFYVLVYYAF